MNEIPAAGFVPVDKPVGPSSHDIVAVARRALRQRRIGHTGTLDPFASGLLLLAIGRATRLVEYLSGLAKSYSAVLRLGQSTDTDDLTGTVIASSDAWRDLGQDEIRAAVESMTGVIRQVPPMYSARKVGGRRLYAMAREGIEIEREATEAAIHSIAVTNVTGPDVAFQVTCSTGTYVRSLARDAGSTLGVGAHLIELRRTAIGPHRVESAVPPERLEDAAAVRDRWISPARALAHLPSVEIDERDAAALAQGRAVRLPELADAELTAAVGRGRLIAVGEISGGLLRPRKVFVE